MLIVSSPPLIKVKQKHFTLEAKKHLLKLVVKVSEKLVIPVSMFFP